MNIWELGAFINKVEKANIPDRDKKDFYRQILFDLLDQHASVLQTKDLSIQAAEKWVQSVKKLRKELTDVKQERSLYKFQKDTGSGYSAS